MSHSEDIGQHYIECAICTNYSKFYCNTCHHRLCEQHKESHLNEAEYTKHEIVLYQERIQELPTEKCLIHPKRDLEIYCNECQFPVCSKCFITDHNGHEVFDLEVVYNESLKQCQKELIKLQDIILPQSEEKLKSWRGGVETVKEEIAKMRLSMKKSADEIKATVDTILAENNSELDKMEMSILDDMCTEDKEVEQYISHIKERIKVYESGTSLGKPSEIFTFRKEITSTSLVESPDTNEPVLPAFIEGTIAKQEIEKQFGKIIQCDPKTQNKEKQILQTSLPSHPRKIIKIKEIPMPKLRNVIHISFSPSGEVWASDDHGNLVQSDLQGNLLQVKSINKSPITGCHTVTTEGDLLYIYRGKRAIYKVSRNKTTTLTTTWTWTPEAIYSSHMNGDVLVGMYQDKDWKVTRYNKEGEKTQDIQKDDRGQDLYHSIEYITENSNGDICVSDWAANKVVVVTRSGKHRFSYSGDPSQSGFSPSGICTDVLGRILVCNGRNLSSSMFSSIHLLDKNGQFLTFLLAPQNPRDVCIDDKQNLWVGCQGNPVVTVYKYLEEIDK
ncbi:uncharacterized protein LOC125648917 [Ostrea edulis]|uniref:uncharacterized protein LOC125648917 n=1 Tax=Ostrea edulis TaxID=37623 RepID=UPI0024AEE513|nr:uncharacterized protein LOC125648917 [Ostrea edulis]